MSASEGVPSIEELDRLPTEELRRRAFQLADDNHDRGFVWEIIRHVPSSVDLSVEDASAGNITGSIAELAELFGEVSGKGLGPAEPLIRARLIDYIRRGE